MDILKKIEQWGDERDITTQRHNTNGFISNIVEELAELKAADKADDINERIDAINDIIIFCITELPKLGVTANETLPECYKEINSRVGSWSEELQKWQKDKSPEAQANWYKAKYVKEED